MVLVTSPNFSLATLPSLPLSLLVFQNSRKIQLWGLYHDVPVSSFCMLFPSIQARLSYLLSIAYCLFLSQDAVSLKGKNFLFCSLMTLKPLNTACHCSKNSNIIY